ncbi:MAG TPA: PP2C family protein-serine/threonine phosphatase [Terriglobales bacterium]|nr:PP2C family protein-serine/threonine phosphatase [Terriglobales bacterium]
MLRLSTTLRRVVWVQLLLFGVAAAVSGLLWGVGQQVNFLMVFICSFFIGNTGFLFLVQFSSLFCRYKFPYDWLAFLALLIAITPFTVAGAILIAFWLDAPSGTNYWMYLSQGWKLPSLVTIVFGVVYNLFCDMRSRLERHNRELQETVEKREAEWQKQEEDLQRAREIQESLLPKKIPQINGFDIAGAWEPARVVGGDYFDVIKLSETKVAICIADVVGKGTSAALLMANVQASVRAFASESMSPASLCSRINGVLCNNIGSDKFVTFFYGVLDVAQRSLTYCNAGHLRPIAIQPSRAPLQLDSSGVVLGVVQDGSYEDSVLPLGSGDRLLLFTDGITEAMREDGEEFGEERLVASARNSSRHQADQMKSFVMEDVRAFCRSQFHDDATLLAVAVN